MFCVAKRSSSEVQGKRKPAIRRLVIVYFGSVRYCSRAKAEERRAAAVALEQEMRAKVVEAEAEIPQAMAEAFRSGNMGIMDYYNLKNIQSDTDMRTSIADSDKDKDEKK